MKLEDRLREISIELTNQVIAIICSLSPNELNGMAEVGSLTDLGKPRKEKTMRKRPARPKKKVTASRQAAARSPQTNKEPQAVNSPPATDTVRRNRPRVPRRSELGSPKQPRPTPPSRSTPPALKRSVSSHHKEIEARLETAVFDFVSEHPGAGAQLVSRKLVIPVSKAQSVLAAFVLKGRMRMEPGEQGQRFHVAKTG